MFSRIVVPLDGSPLAESVLTVVRRLAADSALEVILLGVVHLPPALAMADELTQAARAHGGTLPDADNFVAEVEHDLTGPEAERVGAYLATRAEALRRDGIAARTHVAIGDAATEIVRHAAAEHADAIAMSTHGRGALGRLLHGSVAGAVLRAAERPVLVWRPPAEAFGE